MANEDDILQRIILQGTEEARKELLSLGADGEAALKRIEAAGNGDFGAGLRKISPEIKKFQDGMAKAEAAGSRLPGVFGRIAVAIRGIKGSSFGGDFEAEADKVTGASKSSSSAVRGLALTLRALSRATGAHELGQFASVLRNVHVNIGLIAFPALIASLGGIARSAANATQVMQDLAFAAGELPGTFAAAANAVTAVGGSSEKLGEALSKLPALTKTAKANQDAAAGAARDYRTALEGAADAVGDSLDAIVPLDVAQRRLTANLVAGRIAGQQYHDAQRDIDLQRAKANQALAAAHRAELKVTEDYQRNKAAALENADALTKLGIAAATFKRLTSTGKEDVIANALQNFSGSETEKKALALEIFGESARKLFPSLLKGAEGMATLRKEAERIEPTFTTAQNAIGDRFVEAATGLGAAVTSLKNQFGLAIAPAFTDFINTLKEAFIAARPSVVDFGEAVGSVLKPIFEGIGSLIANVIVPALKLLSGLFSTAAGVINSLFGSNLTGAQLFVVVVVSLVAAFAPLVPLIIIAAAAVTNLWEQLKKLDFVKSLLASAQEAWKRISEGFAVLWQLIKGLFTGGVDGAVAEFEKLPPAGKRIFVNLVTDAVNALLFLPNAVLDICNRIGGFFTDLWERVKQGAREAGRSIAQALGLAKGNGAFTHETGDVALGLAGGGRVSGPGTGTSDSILARLSNGEFVMRLRAVQKYGLNFMQAVNSGKLDLRKHVKGFNLGGLVSSMMPRMPVPRFAEGGMVATGGGLRPVQITFDGAQFDAMMADNALESLHKKSIAYRARRAGKRPGYIGG